MNSVSLIIQLISGAVGGNLVGATRKQFTLGPIGNSAVGAIGGLLAGWLFDTISGRAPSGAAAAAFDVGSLLISIIGGAVGGALLMWIVGLIRALMHK